MVDEISDPKSTPTTSLFNLLTKESSEKKLGRGIIPVLNSSNKNQKNYKEEFPDICIQNIKIKKEILMTISVSSSSQKEDVTKVEVLLDSGANVIFIDRAFAAKARLPFTPL